MTDLRTLLQYRIFYNSITPLIAPRDIYLALFNIQEQGPNVLARDNQDWTWLNAEMRVDEYLNQFAIYAMIAITQGENYTEGVHLLPVGGLQERKVILISLLSNQPDLTIHERYLQVALFLSRDLVERLPNLTYLEHDLLRIAKLYISSNTRVDYQQLRRLKLNIINFLNNYDTHI